VRPSCGSFDLLSARLVLRLIFAAIVLNDAMILLCSMLEKLHNLVLFLSIGVQPNAMAR
jgi:hypothetical protein